MKEEYDLKAEKHKGKTKYDYKRKQHVSIEPSTGIISKTVRQFYGDLKNAKNNDGEFVRAVKNLLHDLTMKSTPYKTRNSVSKYLRYPLQIGRT